MRVVPWTFSSLTDDPNADTTTNYSSYWNVMTAPCNLLSILGYNSGGNQYLQLFDAATTPTLAITDSVATTDVLTAAAHGLHTGQRVQVSGIAGISDGTICYARRIDADTFTLYGTRAQARTGGATGRQNASGNGDTGTLSLIPEHSILIGATNNFSFDVPVAGLGFGKGLLVAVSTTQATYTAGAKEISFSGALNFNA